MQGAGNDYVYVDATSILPENLPDLARRISDRHFGVGGDGLVIILPSDRADFRMRMFNADGSEAQMCGNASRCVGKFVYDRGLTDKKVITLETLAGIKTLTLFIDKKNMVERVRVDMGAPELRPDLIPVRPSSSRSSDIPYVIMTHAGVSYQAIAVSMGNPHGVIFIEEKPSDFHILKAGKEFETHPAWPEKANIEFARVISPDEVEMRVWERGSGETLACGTGACATAVAGIMTGRLERKVKVKLLGGVLEIEWDETSGHVFMTGPAATVAEGIYFRPATSG
ncbi:MAG: diaminopimelate epimerase [Muribaculaceae bacterium]|nr:diaminopimelate epimerase [Muribaculaceae bacterium]